MIILIESLKEYIRNKEEHIQVQEKTIQEQGAELERLREEKRKYDEYIIKRNRILKLIGGCIVAAIIFFVMVIIISKISNKIRPETSKSIEVIIDSCGIIVFLISVFSKIKKYIYNEHEKNDDKKN